MLVTVTVPVHWLDAPWLSVTVSVTVVAPGGYGPGGAWPSVIVSCKSGSKEPLFTDAVAVPPAPAGTVTFRQIATGGWFAQVPELPA